MKNLIICLMVFLASTIARGQDIPENQSDTLRKDALNVYYERATSYVKENIPYINYVRDRKVADLVIISASESTGSGGTKYTLFLEGQLKCAGMMDTLRYSSTPDDTTEERREEQVKTLKKGLVRYVLKTPLSKYIDVRFTEPIATEVTSDKWNNWVFRAGLNGSAFASQSNDYYNLSTNISAKRITEDWKITFSARYSVNFMELRWMDQTTNIEQIEKDKKKSSNMNLLIVKSLGEHWSAGFTSGISSSIYSNYIAHFSFKPGIEYNVFPFSQSTRKQFRFMYTIGPVYNNYCDTTVYFKKNEIIGQQSLMAAYMNIQKWGDFNISTSWQNYLHDWDLSRLSFNGSVSLNVAKGLRLNLFGGYSFIHDQINLLKGAASTSDVLLSRQELATTYSYDLFFGISYTFGSIYSNVVNPRFQSRGGGGYVVIR